MSDGYARRSQSAGRAARRPTPIRHRSLPVPVTSMDSQDWRGPALSDLESEYAVVRAATRSSPLRALHESPPPSHGRQPKGRAALTIGSQTPPATRASNAFHPYCQAHLASRDREYDPRSPQDLPLRQPGRRHGGSNRARFAADRPGLPQTQFGCRGCRITIAMRISEPLTSSAMIPPVSHALPVGADAP